MKRIITILSLMFILVVPLLTSCGITNENPVTPLSNDTAGTDITITPIERKYYFDDNIGALVYFSKDTESGLYDLIFAYDGQKKEIMLSLSQIPQSYIIDDGYFYFYSINATDNYPNSLSPRIDSAYEIKQKRLKEVSPFFGGNSYGNLYRANLATKEIQWLGSSIEYLLDDDHIYFMELPIDYDQYGMGRPKGDIVFHNSLCRMEKDGANPILIRSEVYGLNYITDKYIYAHNVRLDKSTFKAEALLDSDEIYIENKVCTKDKVFYSKWESANDPPFYSVYCYDLLTAETVKIADFPQSKYTPGLELIPLDSGGLIVRASDSQNRETLQVAKIYFYDKEFKFEKAIDANGRHQISVKNDSVFYLLQEINDGKSIYDYTSENVYATLTLCRDDISMQGENIIRIDVIDDSVYY